MRTAYQLLTLYLLACTINVSANILDGIAGYDIYDYVVIGGGGAGLVMANRLSEDRTKTVLVLHRGFDDVCVACDQGTTNNPPEGGVSTLNDGLGERRNGANYFSTPQLFPGRVIREVRSNLPGGGTRLYGGVSIPSAKALIDSKWPINYETMRPYFNKYQDHYCNYLSPNVTGISPADCAKYHGQAGGPMSISPPNQNDRAIPISKDFYAAAPEFGVKFVPDPYNPAYQTGQYVYPQHSFANRANPSDINSTRTRESTYTGYTPQSLRRARSNLKIEFGAEARQLVYRSDLFGMLNIEFLLGLPIFPRSETKPRIVGVQYKTAVDDKRRIVFARKHVVLCAGVEGSPKFLQYNGIGPADLLAKAGVPLVAENKNVGQGIVAHSAVSMVFKTKDFIPTTTENNGKIFIMQLSSPQNEGWADIEVEVDLGIVVKSFDFALTGTDPLYYTSGNAQGLYPYISAFVEVVNPSTRGSINITSPKWEELTRVEYGWPKGFDYGTSPDFQKLQWAFAKLRDVFTGNNTFAKKYIDSENAPGRESNPTDQFNTDMFYSAFHQHSIYHTTGGVALGLATDNNGLLKGVNGLSVCDNSLTPHAPNGNPTSTMLALCEYVADKIKTY